MLELSSNPIIEITNDALSHLKELVSEAEHIFGEPAFTIISWAEVGSMPVSFPPQGSLADEEYAKEIQRLYREHRPKITTNFKVGVSLERLSILQEEERHTLLKNLKGVPIAIDVGSFSEVMPDTGLLINIDASTQRLNQVPRLSV